MAATVFSSGFAWEVKRRRTAAGCLPICRARPAFETPASRTLREIVRPSCFNGHVNEKRRR